MASPRTILRIEALCTPSERERREEKRDHRSIPFKSLVNPISFSARFSLHPFLAFSFCSLIWALSSTFSSLHSLLPWWVRLLLTHLRYAPGSLQLACPSLTAVETAVRLLRFNLVGGVGEGGSLANALPFLDPVAFRLLSLLVWILGPVVTTTTTTAMPCLLSLDRIVFL